MHVGAILTMLQLAVDKNALIFTLHQWLTKTHNNISKTFVIIAINIHEMIVNKPLPIAAHHKMPRCIGEVACIG